MLALLFFFGNIVSVTGSLQEISSPLSLDFVEGLEVIHYRCIK